MRRYPAYKDAMVRVRVACDPIDTCTHSLNSAIPNSIETLARSRVRKTVRRPRQLTKLAAGGGSSLLGRSPQR